MARQTQGFTIPMDATAANSENAKNRALFTQSDKNATMEQQAGVVVNGAGPPDRLLVTLVVRAATRPN
jgi:hypothetical protein